MCPTPRISFFGSQVFGFGSGPSWLKYRLLRDLVYEEAMCDGKFQKRTTLRSKSSTSKGLLYAGWRSHCELFVARKVRTIALERSVSKKAVSWQATINFYSRVGYPWWFHTWAVLRSLANARKCQLKDFCEKPTRSVPETWGRMYNVLALRK